MLGMIWAQGKSGAIGKSGTIPWRVPEDMQIFKQLTIGHPVIMGRRTWESLGDKFRPLPQRTNFVVTRQSDYKTEGAHVCADLTSAIEAAAAVTGQIGDTLDNAPLNLSWIIGGASLYKHALAQADILAVTDIDIEVPEADTFAPKIDAAWEIYYQNPPVEDLAAPIWRQSKKGINYRFRLYTRQDTADFARAAAVAEAAQMEVEKIQSLI